MAADKNGNSPKDSLEQERARQKEKKTKKKEQDDYLEEALEETFPASDPIAPGHTNHGKK